MLMTTQSESKNTQSRNVKLRLDDPKTGLLLMDLSLKPIAYDRGAAAILNNKTSPAITPKPSMLLPKAALDVVSNLKSDQQASVKVSIDNTDYLCTFYLIEPQEQSGNHVERCSSPRMVAVHIEKVAYVTDAVSVVATKYNLTEREGEALSLLSMGLCSKEVASRMNISPNTVKVFLRLIMLKMGVSSRGEIVAEILQSQNSLIDA